MAFSPGALEIFNYPPALNKKNDCIDGEQPGDHTRHGKPLRGYCRGYAYLGRSRGGPFQADEYYRLTNAEGEVLTRSADGWSGNMPWKATSIPGYLPSPSVAYSDYYLLEVNVQRTSGRWASTGFSLNDTGGDWCNIGESELLQLSLRRRP